jgi:hypothetical protein
MTENYLEELKATCQKAVTLSDKKTLEIGETIWLAGRAGASTKDTVALEIGNGQRIVIEEKDIIEVQKDAERYLVRVKSGTEVLCRFEGVSQVRPTASKCHCDDAKGETQPSVVARRIIISPWDAAGCTIKWICVDWVDKQGYVRRICIPILECEPRIFV